MGIFQRISDIISANLGEMIEQHEDPELLLKQVVREMEDSIRTSTKEVAKAMANQKLTARELSKNEEQVRVWGERATTAVDAGDDDLARKALTRKREYEKIVAALRDEHDTLQETTHTLRNQLEAMQAKLSEAQRRLGTLAARKRAADVRARMAQTKVPVELDDDAFAKFDRLERKVEMAEAEAEAMAELVGGYHREGDEPAPVRSEQDELEAELAELKRKKGT